MFREQTYPDLNQEMMEDLILLRDEILESLNADEGAAKSRQQCLTEQLRGINKALGDEDEKYHQDALADYWDAQLDRGEVPDLDMTLADLEAIQAQ